MSFYRLIADASLLVQIVMIILVLASVISWTMIFSKARVLKMAIKEANAFEDRFWSGMDLSQLYREVTDEPAPFGVENIFAAGFREFSRLRQQSNAEPEAIMEGVQRAMRVATVRETEILEHHLPFLATVGSTSPYVGLFGTVWGIMHSFLDIGEQSSASLNVVAPGIAALSTNGWSSN